MHSTLLKDQKLAVLRIHNDAIVALFPEIPGNGLDECQSSIGVVNLPHFMKDSKPVDFKVVTRETSAMKQRREASLYTGNLGH